MKTYGEGLGVGVNSPVCMPLTLVVLHISISVCYIDRLFKWREKKKKNATQDFTEGNRNPISWQCFDGISHGLALAKLLPIFPLRCKQRHLEIAN